MAVNKMFLLMLPLLIAFFSNQCLSKDNQVLKLLDDEVQNQLALLSDSISQCQKIASTSKLKLNLDAYKELKVSKKTFLKALYYLNLRNRNLCESKHRNALVFAINQLDFIRSELDLARSMYSDSSAQLLYESKDVLQLQLDYKQTNEVFREMLEKQIGTTVFDFNVLLQNTDTNLLNE